MYLTEDTEDESLDNEVAVRFLNHIDREPLEAANDKDARAVFDHIRRQTDIMLQKSAQFKWLLDAVTDDKFVMFYIRYLQLLCNTSQVDYLTQPKNHTVSSFIKIQMIVWNITDQSEKLCFKLQLKEISYYLLNLLKLPQIHPSVCLIENNARLLVHSSVGVLHNLLNHVPNVRASYRSANGVRVLTPFVTRVVMCELPDINKQLAVQYLSLRTASLLVLSFIIDETENEALCADDSHIVYLLIALDDALKSPGRLFSAKYGYGARELLVGLKNLAGSDRNKVALIKNDAMKYIEMTLKIANEIKFPYTPQNVLSLFPPHPVNADVLVENTLEFLWSLSFVPDSHPYFTPGSAFRRLFEKFTIDSSWPSVCRRVAQGILWNLSSALPPQLCVNSENIPSLMAAERQQPRRNGHLMISYQHSTKALMLKVRDRLIGMGYSVWMDVDYTSGSFVDLMACGVEKASGLILGLSQAFKNSPHCRQEVKYAYNLGIPLFPLQLEPNFNADGWLGLVLATIIYIPLTDESMVPAAMGELQKQLGDLGHRSRAASQEAVISSRLLNETSFACSSSGICRTECDEFKLSSLPKVSFTMEAQRGQTALPTNDSSNDIQLVRVNNPIVSGPRLRMSPTWTEHSAWLRTWTTADVSNWLQREDLSEYQSAFSSLDGPMLAELERLRLIAPDGLTLSLYRDLHMNLIDQLRFFAALDRLSLHIPSGSYPS